MVTKTVLQVIAVICVTVLFSAPAIAQNQREEKIRKRLEYYKEHMLKSQNENITQLTDPKITEFVEIAKRAIRQLDTKERNETELRSVANRLDEKLGELLINDVGRWLATDEQSVKNFILLDEQYLAVSTSTINTRLDRLYASIKSLESFNSTQGEFNPKDHQAVRAIIADASWAETMLTEAKSRLAVIEKLESGFPGGKDWSKHPTLAQAKREYLAKIELEASNAELDAKDQARKESIAKMQKAAFERKMRQTNAEIEAQDAMAELTRKLTIEESKLQQAEIDAKIATTQARRDRVNADKRNAIEMSNQAKLEAYLTSPRVKQLLAPFCNPGRTLLGARNQHFQIDELEPRPISLNRLTTYKFSGAAYKPLEPTRPGMSRLIQLANLKDNDRGSWPVGRESWESAGNTFKDMDGNMVNPYREAQRILREHGQTLVALGMLVD